MSPQICDRPSQYIHARLTVAAYRDRRVDAHDIALLDQQLARLIAQFAHLVLRYRPACAQLCDGPVEVAAADAHGCPLAPDEGCGGVAAACLARRGKDTARCSGGVASCVHEVARWGTRRVGGEEAMRRRGWTSFALDGVTISMGGLRGMNRGAVVRAREGGDAKDKDGVEGEAAPTAARQGSIRYAAASPSWLRRFAVVCTFNTTIISSSPTTPPRTRPPLRTRLASQLHWYVPTLAYGSVPSDVGSPVMPRPHPR